MRSIRELALAMVASLLGACAHVGVPGAENANEPTLVWFPTPDGGVAYANAYGAGTYGIVLGSNGCQGKEGWAPQARALVAAGFRALAIDFRGVGQSHGGSPSTSQDDAYHLDVLGAVRYLHATGATRVSVMGASCAGDATAQASVDARPGEIERIVLLAFSGIATPERIQGRKLFVVARDDANDAGKRLPAILRQYERAPQPKELLILDGSAHAQRIFATPQGDSLMRTIVRFLGAP